MIRECFFSARMLTQRRVEKDSLMREISEFNNIMEDRLRETLAGLFSLGKNDI